MIFSTVCFIKDSLCLFVYLSKSLILSGSLQIIWLVFHVFELKSNAFDDQIANSDWHIFIKKILCAYFIITIISTAKLNSIAFLFRYVMRHPPSRSVFASLPQFSLSRL